MDIQDSFLKSATITTLIFILFKTDALVEYTKVLRLKKIFKIDEYLCFKISSGGNVNYFDFIKNKNNNFITRLISCPYCLGLWLSLIANQGNLKFTITYCLYLIMYKIITFENGKIS